MNENDNNVAVLEPPVIRNKEITSFHKSEIVDKLALETPQRQIANQYNVSQTRISKINQENKHLVNQKKQELLSELPSVVDIIRDDLTANKLLSKRIRMNPFNVDSDKISLKNTLDKTSVNILKIAGIVQPHMNMINSGTITVNQQNIVNPSITKLIGNATLDQLDSLDNVDNSDISDVQS